jgi:serine protease AprX
MKIRSILLAIFLTIGTIFSSMVPVKATTASTAIIDSELLERFTDLITPQQVIVTFKNNSLANDEIFDLLKEIGITKGVVLKELPMAGILATKSQVELLAKNENVFSIYYNKRLTYDNKEATELTGVDKLREEDAYRKANSGLPISGKGVGVVINDSGVDGTHKDHEFGSHLVQNVLAATNLNAQNELLPISYIENVPNTDTSSGHGTHVAGIVGGTGAMSGGEYEGVAPGANLIGYGSGAAVAMLDTLGGFEYALTHQHQYNIRVITNSWGDTSDVGTDFDPFDPINIATKALYDRGIVTVFSAGTQGRRILLFQETIKRLLGSSWLQLVRNRGN